MSNLAVIAILFYRWLLSAFLHQALGFSGGCRFYPTCSHYGLRAVRQYGLVDGFMLLLKRLVRCQPWSPGGYDPLPGP